MKDYIGYSGGAEGSDQFWMQKALEFGIGEFNNFYPDHLDRLTPPEMSQLERAYWDAADNLRRPLLRADTYAGRLVRRDYLQAKAGQAIFAVGYIIKPGEKTRKGKRSYCTRDIVDGGTGYCVQMAINMNKPVFVFDQKQDRWFQWNYEGEYFQVMDIMPILTKKYTAVGTRELIRIGERAIVDIYEYTKVQQQNINNHVK